MRRVFARFAAVFCALILAWNQFDAPSVQAAPSMWNGTVDNTWNTAGNWTPSGVPASDIANTDLTFSGTMNTNPNNANVSLSIHSIVFDSSAGIFVISGSTQTTGAGGITNSSTSSQTMNTDLVVAAPQTWSATSGALNFGGAITLNSNLTVSSTSGNPLSISGNMAGAGGFIKTGGGAAILTGSNTYTGGTTVSAGTLTGSTTSLQGTITDNANVTFDQTSTGTFSGNLSGTGTLTKSSAGTVTLATAVTITGGVIINAGTLQAGGSGTLPGNVAYTINGGTLDLNDFNLSMSSLSSPGPGLATVDLGSATLTVNNSANTTYSGVITGTGGLVKSNTGTFLLSGANNYTGGTTVTAGTLQGDTTSLQGANPANTIAVSAGASAAFSQTFDGAYSGVVSGTGSLIKSGSGNVTLSGANTYSGGTTVSAGTLTGTTTSLQGNIADNAAVVFDQAADGTYAGAISGSGGVTKLGVSNVTFSGANSYTGGTTVSAGTLTGTTTSLKGNIADNSHLVFDQAADGTYTGIISGTGDLKKLGVGNTTITGANTYTGGTTVSAGTLTGTTTSLQGDILDNATLTFDQDNDGTYADTISGTGALTKEGLGIVTLSGINTYTGATTINDGALNVDGTLANTSGVEVGASGTLGGIGTVNSSVHNVGTVSAGNTGNPTGMLTLQNFNNDGGTMLVNTDGAASNLISVTGSTTFNGGTVNVVSSTGSVNAGTKFEFLDSGTPIDREADPTVEDNLPGLLEAVLSYSPDGTMAFVTVLRNGQTYAAVGNTFNELAVGHYLDQISPTASGDLQTVFDTLNSIDDPELRVAESQMAGSLHGTLGQIGVQNTTLIVGQIAQRLRSSSMTPTTDCCCQCGGCQPEICSGLLEHSLFAPVPPCGGSNWTGWTQGFGLGGNAKTDGNAGGVNYGMGGVMAGLERWLDDSRLLGFYGGYTGSTIQTDAPNSFINGGNFGGYLYADDGFNYWTILNGYEFDSYNTHRMLQFGDIDREASASYDGWQAYVYAERGVSYESCGRLFQPFVGLQYLYLRQNGFTEHGADSIDLAANGVNTNSLRSLLGARLQWAWSHRTCRRSFPEIHAYWLHEYIDSHTIVDATFSPTPDNGSTPFIAHGLDFGRDWAILGASFTWEMHGGWSMFVNGDIQTNNQATLYLGSGGLGHVW